MTVLVIRDQSGAEVTKVPVYGKDAELANAIAHNIRASLSAGFWLDYPDGNYQQAARTYFQGERRRVAS